MDPTAPIACVGAGTGLGEVYLTWRPDAGLAAGGEHCAWPSEGGMTEFHAHDDTEWALRKHLSELDGHVTVGQGLCRWR